MTRSITIAITVVLAVGVFGRRAAAGPALADFVAAAHGASLELREQAALTGESRAAIAVEGAALWPSVSASAGYTRNQHDTVVTIPRGTGDPIEATILPLDQLEATLQLDVPLIDLGARRRIGAARDQLDATQATAAARAAEIDRQVVRAYYQWVGGRALRDSASSAEHAAADNVAYLDARAKAGLVKDLDVARARAQLARARQSIADAELAIASARRALRTLTGLDAEGDAPPLATDTAAEPALDTWLPGAAQAPEVAAATANQRAAASRRRADQLAFAPTLGAFARERITNAAGFGDAANWSAGITLSWRLDRRTQATLAQARTVEVTGAVRLARAAEDARDRIVDAWDQVEAIRARADAAAAQAEADALARDVAAAKLASGDASQLDVVLAQRDALDADVALVQARADLAAARALLRLAASRPVSP